MKDIVVRYRQQNEPSALEVTPDFFGSGLLFTVEGCVLGHSSPVRVGVLLTSEQVRSLIQIATLLREEGEL